MKYSTPIPKRSDKKRIVFRRRIKAKSGRSYIFLLFLWLRAIDAGVLYFLYPRLFPHFQNYLILSIVSSATWTTGLLVAIWFRQSWAKYVLSGSLLLTVISTLSTLPGLPDSSDPQKQLIFVMGVTGAYFPVAMSLLLSRSIHKLTREKFGKLYE